jgi:hypothetical protein
MQFPIGRGIRLKWLAVGFIAAIEIGAFAFLVVPSLSPTANYYHYYPTTSGTASTSATTTLKKTTNTKAASAVPSIEITSATITGGTLRLAIKNVGAVSTASLTLFGICTPGFANCYNYTTIGGPKPEHVFVLAPKRSYVEYLPGVCVAPEMACTNYHPVANFTYYLVVRFTALSGKSVYLAVATKATDTSPTSTAVQGVVYSFPVFSKNSSGSLTAYIKINPSASKAAFSGTLYTQRQGGVFTLALLSKIAGCGGAYPVACSTGNVTMSMKFSTVTAGVATPLYPGPFLLVVRDLTSKRLTYFAMWVQYKQKN